MRRTCGWVLIAALVTGGAAMVGGCQSDQAPLPPGENGTRAGGNGAFGSQVVQPGEGAHDMNGTGSNGNQMDMNGMH
jgi:hypothetical protein